MRRAAPLLAVVVLAAPATASAAVRSGVDGHGGMRLTLDGRVLTAKIVHRKAEGRLFGNQIDAICSSSSRPLLREVVIRTRRWPAGARRMSFAFGRDISRRVKWCLIEHDASDIAFVSFVRREPWRFVGKGRGPSGGWWRLAGRRGRFAEPCALLRIRGWGSRPCFEQFSERPITLGVEEFGVCGRDLFVLGVVSSRAASVRVVTAGGEVVEAKLYDPASGSRVRGRYFVAALPEDTLLSRVESLDAAGNILASRSIEDQAPGPCDR